MITVLVGPFRVDRHNPIEEAKPLLLRDLANLESYFAKYWVQLDAEIEYSRLIPRINQLAVTGTACLTPTMSGCVDYACPGAMARKESARRTENHFARNRGCLVVPLRLV
jgi:hypothetical protein